MRPQLWRRTYHPPLMGSIESVQVTSYEMGTLFGPFGGGWTTKFGVMIGGSTIIAHAWRWEVRIELDHDSTH